MQEKEEDGNVWEEGDVMGAPLISVVLANYNGARFLQEAIDCVCRQTYENWELILVDDGSTDDSWQIMTQQRDPRIRLHRNGKNLQVAEAHNIGFSLAQGEYIALMDHDDHWDPRKLELQLAYLEAHSQVAACFAWPDFMDEQGKNYEDENLSQIYHVENRSRPEWVRLLLTTGNHLANDSVLVRREVLLSLGRENPAYTQLHDFDLWLRLAMNHELYVLPQFLMSYRNFPGSDSNSAQTEQNQRRLFFEYAYIVGHAIRNMEGELFCQAFQDQLVNPHPASPEEILCEKALLLSRDLFPFNCREHAFALLEQIQRDPEASRLLAQDYAVSPQEIHQLSGRHILYDRLIEERMRAADQEIRVLSANRDETVQAYQKASADFISIQQSFFWRCTAPLRKLTGLRSSLLGKNEKLALSLRLGKVALTQGREEAAKRKAAYLYEQRMCPIYGGDPMLPWDQWEAQRQTTFPEKITFSLLVPLYHTPEKMLEGMIASVQAQSYPHWELCLADGSDGDQGAVQHLCQRYAAQDQRIKYRRLERNLGISGNTNACLEMATGEYYALLDHDDLLHPAVLFSYAQAIHQQGADALYCDEAVFTDTPSSRCDAKFKPDFCPDTLRSYNYICHFLAFSRKLLPEKEPLLRPEMDGSQDYDLILRIAEKAKNFVHVPHVLYYWRSSETSVAGHLEAKPYALEAAKKALSAHLDRVGLPGRVLDGKIPSTYRIAYELSGAPLVSILIPTKDHRVDLYRCVESVLQKTTYPNYEILIIDNQSQYPQIQQLYDQLSQDSRIRILRWDHPFNFSQICNFGAKETGGEYLLLLNNDTKVISENWIQEMLMLLQRPDVGAVGARLFYPDDTIQHAGIILRPEGFADHIHKYRTREDLGYEYRLQIVQNFSAVTGACLMTKKSCWQEVGGMDEALAVAYNDVDYCLQLRARGYLVVWTPYAELYHYESKSRGLDDTPAKQAVNRRELDLMNRRWAELMAAGDPCYNPHLVHTSLKADPPLE